ncbi:hypothetical protein [Pyruvatibacter mobilis]|uniref:hypothetical protein n=1 Tax=Pyruvatibacter mobilis TaxID=1712261 RepID=UPI003BACF54F
MTVAVLCAHQRSVYFDLDGCDVYDAKRDARTYTGLFPVVAHPPCRAWGKWAWRARPEPGERELAMFCVDQVQRCGGVLEHPAYSTLWAEKRLPLPGCPAQDGSFTLPILQSDFGHKAPKATWLYINGIAPSELPPMPMRLGEATGRIEMMGRTARMATPVELATWLRDLAEKTTLARAA